MDLFKSQFHISSGTFSHIIDVYKHKNHINMKVLTFLLYFSSVFALFQDNFSSAEPKAQVPVVRLSVNFSHFQLLLQNHLANFNKTWHKPFLGEAREFKFVQIKGPTLFQLSR